MNISYYKSTESGPGMPAEQSLKEQVIELVEATNRERAFFPEGIDIPQYVNKIFTQAVVLPFVEEGILKAVLSFYCNDKTTKRAFFSLLAVASDQRRRGIGYLLMESGFRFSKLNGCEFVETEVYKDNVESFRMCEKLGFSRKEDKGKFYVLTKRLD